MLEVGRSDAVSRWNLGPIVGDAKTAVVERIGAIGLNFTVQFFRQCSLLNLLRFWCKTSQLIPQLFDFFVSIIFMHLRLSQRLLPVDLSFPATPADRSTIC